MYEIFVMPLATYWDELEDLEIEAKEAVKDLQKELTEYYGKTVNWVEPDEIDVEDIEVSLIEDNELMSLYVVAAKLETSENIDNIDLDPENPWDSEVFDELEKKLDDGGNIDLYHHLLMPQNSPETIYVPVDLPNTVSLFSDEAAAEMDENFDEADYEENGSICVASLTKLRTELDKIQKILKTDPEIDIEDENVDIEFEQDDSLSSAKIAWYVLNTQINNAVKAKLPLIIRYVHDEEYDELGEDFEDEE